MLIKELSSRYDLSPIIYTPEKILSMPPNQVFSLSFYTNGHRVELNHQGELYLVDFSKSVIVKKFHKRYTFQPSVIPIETHWRSIYGETVSGLSVPVDLIVSRGESYAFLREIKS